MDQKNSEIKFTLNSDPQEDYVEDDEELLWNKKKKGVISRWFKMPEDIPYSWIAIGCLILIIFLLLIFPKKKGKVGEKQFLAMVTQINRLENRVAKIEDIDEKVTKIWEQAKDFEKFKVRFDRQQASLLLRLDNLTKDMNRLKKRVGKLKPVTVEPTKTGKNTEGIANKKYHTVSSGETLYGIGRQYGLTVEKIRLINKLADGTAIHPGQKLLVKP